MSVSYAPTKLRVPLGFEHLLEALAREVLREQPKDIINFAAEYFRRKLVLRDEGTLDSTAAAEESTTTKSEDSQPKQAQPSVEQNMVNIEQSEVVDIDLSDPGLHKAASTIQATFRTYRKKEEAKRNKEEEEEQLEVVDKTEPPDQTSEVLPDIDLDDPELNKAASVIQSNFRTHLSKKNKTTEQAETQEESEGVGGDTEPSTSHTEDSNLTKAESTTNQITPESEESNADDQVAPPAEVQEESEGKEDVAENDPEPPTSESQRIEEQEASGNTEEAPSQPVADEEQPIETKGEDTSKETETQAGGDGDLEKLPEKVEESKEENGSGDDGNGVGGNGDDGNGDDGNGAGGNGDDGNGDDGNGDDGNGAGGSQIEPTEGTGIENVKQAEVTDGGENQEAPKGDEATGDSKEAPSDEAS